MSSRYCSAVQMARSSFIILCIVFVFVFVFVFVPIVVFCSGVRMCEGIDM